MKKILLILTIILTLTLGIMTYLYINANKNLKDLEKTHLETSEELWKANSKIIDLTDQLKQLNI